AAGAGKPGRACCSCLPRRRSGSSAPWSWWDDVLWDGGGRESGMWTLLARLTIPFLVQHRLRSLLVSLSVTVGVATAVGLDLTGRSVVASAHSAVDAVAGRAQLTVSNAESGVPEAVLATVRETPGVAAAMPVEQLAVSTVGLDGEQLEVI